ncbi:hypothetical protein [Streptomyces sp. NPDC057686]|uniref:acyl-CoA-like ligand-binding transcription factor n=1 Tax=Streptomyces sp. NPDC057686 TaxID=3346212 RepID=UPI0036CDB4D1
MLLEGGRAHPPRHVRRGPARRRPGRSAGGRAADRRRGSGVRHADVRTAPRRRGARPRPRPPHGRCPGAPFALAGGRAGVAGPVAAGALATRTGRPADSLEVRLLAGAVLDAFTAAVGHWAGQDEPEDLLVLTRRALAFQRVDEL